MNVFNLQQLTGTKLADWKPGNRPRGVPTPQVELPHQSTVPASAAPIVQPEENTMTFRADLRAAIADAGTLTCADIRKKFPDKECVSPLSQMVLGGQLKRKGHGQTAVYSIGQGSGAAKGKTRGARKYKNKSAEKMARRGGPHPHRKRKTKKLFSLSDDLPPITRGGHIEGAIAELRRRREGIDQAIAVLEALA